MDQINWHRYGAMSACPKWEGGWYIGSGQYPIIAGPPGTQPEDHPDYTLVMGLYGSN